MEWILLQQVATLVSILENQNEASDTTGGLNIIL